MHEWYSESQHNCLVPKTCQAALLFLELNIWFLFIDIFAFQNNKNNCTRSWTLFCEIFYFLTILHTLLFSRIVLYFPSPFRLIFPLPSFFPVPWSAWLGLFFVLWGPCAVSPHRYTRTGSLLGAWFQVASWK